MAKLDDQIGKKVALGAKLKICAVLQKPQPHLKNLQEEHTSQMQHRLKKTVMGVATGEARTEIHPEFPHREAEYTAPTTADHGKSSYGWLDCDQAEPSSETPNFHAARENKFQSEGVPPKPST